MYDGGHPPCVSDSHRFTLPGSAMITHGDTKTGRSIERILRFPGRPGKSWFGQVTSNRTNKTTFTISLAKKRRLIKFEEDKSGHVIREEVYI